MYTTSLRFRKWRHHMLDSLQRTEIPVFVKGHVTAAAHRSRSWVYYGSLVLATVYVVSMLQFYSPSTPAALRDPAYRACRRGPQSADRLTFLYHGNERIRQSRDAARGRKRVLLGEEKEQGGKAGRRGKDTLVGEEEAGNGMPENEYLLPELLLLKGGAIGAERGERETKSTGTLAEEAGAVDASPGNLAHESYYHFQGLYVPAVDRPPTRFTQGRGIVITASGRISGQAIGAYVTSFILRRVLGCRLPIEIYFVGPRETFELPLQVKLKELGDIKILSLPNVLDDDDFYQTELRHLHVVDKRLRSYAAKPYAVYAASFEEVLLFDAGVIPFVNPETFFDFDSYRDHGFHLFRDYRELDRTAWGGFVEQEFCADVNELNALLGGTEADSSCVLLHKGRAWDSLLVTMAMNGPLQPFTYARLNGDKDTWALAAALTYQNFSTTETTPGYFMREAQAELTLLDSAYAGWAQPVRGQVQFLRDPSAPGGVVPLYVNNQLLNMTEYPSLKSGLAFGLWEDYGYPFCGWRAVNGLLRPAPEVFDVMDSVARALDAVGTPDECLCKWFRCRFPAPFGADSPFLLRRLLRR